MVDEAQPAAGMLEEHVQSLLKGLASLVMEHVFGLEGLIDRQIDRIVRIGQAGLLGARWFLLFLDAGHIVADNVLLAPFASVLPLHRRRHPLVMRLAEARRAKTPQEGKSTRG